ncbi:hypothetical protein F4604DRAFT_1683706 [Suillus subluteus]|nr:hypothetical protein F4604DRAFT_1683706 [Suillus subluteus]
MAGQFSLYTFLRYLSRVQGTLAVPTSMNRPATYLPGQAGAGWDIFYGLLAHPGHHFYIQSTGGLAACLTGYHRALMGHVWPNHFGNCAKLELLSYWTRISGCSDYGLLRPARRHIHFDA